MSQNLQHLQRTMRSYLPLVESWIPLFALWGIVWIVSAAVDFAGLWNGSTWIRPGLTLLALVASVMYLTFGRVAKKITSVPIYSFRLGIWITLPLGMIVGSASLLRYIQAFDSFFMDIFRALLLAFFYVLIGVFLGKPLVYLGLWLFALITVLSTGYLGFAPVVLEFFGGLSLVVCARIFALWILFAKP